MRGRKILAAALLAGMVSSPMVMAEVLSDDALGGVSAQGFQVAAQVAGGSEQNINNDSVQLNDNAQIGAAGMAVTNSASSAVNVGQNVAGVTDTFSWGEISQTNRQNAENSEASGQLAGQLDVDYSLWFGILADVQNINNGSAQLNDNAQESVAGMAVTNAASSAANVGQNVAGLVNSTDVMDTHDVTQVNSQTAVQDGVNGQLALQADVDVNIDTWWWGSYDFDRQNINNGSVQLNDNAQAFARGMALTNSASSAANVGQNVLGVVDSSVDDIEQRNRQYAENNGINAQLAAQGDVDVQVYAFNVDLDRQNINNGSTQLNDNAQFNAAGMAITNAASSAANVGQNVVGVVDSTTQAIPNDITQKNHQEAVNYGVNGQGGLQVDLDVDDPGISIDIDRQNMNNGSVQLNDAAQMFVRGMAVTNSASSAVNVGQNVAGIIDSSGGDVTQVNNQYAEDGSINGQLGLEINVDTDILFDLNYGEVHANNGSVQLNDNAQANAMGMALTNAAGSAVNVGQNVMGLVNGYSGTLTQTNIQTAVNY
ncbi:hypothetical protein [Nitrosophilus kaiyonis]|uniref:hypothetical protein n=1 Tax=Nitrosophilus kaiyonis TaxID=2930200 RepID=UPI002491BB4D|nr:hypothetical protein [Nitrosophilus kaiyonis]